jgi:hypothetical protein
MKKCIPVIALLLTGCFISGSVKGQNHSDGQNGWISLFDGKTLNGWKASHPESFRVENGYIVADGPRSHLYYMEQVEDHNFKNFEFKVDVMTKHNANSGIYFHTKIQADGFPDNGFEVQENNSGEDWKRTGCLYDIADFGYKYAKDNEWFTIYIKVYGKNVIVKVNDNEVINWTQPAAYVAPKGHPGRYISNGTFAFQEHTKGEIVYFKNIMVKPLP